MTSIPKRTSLLFVLLTTLGFSQVPQNLLTNSILASKQTSTATTQATPSPTDFKVSSPPQDFDPEGEIEISFTAPLHLPVPPKYIAVIPRVKNLIIDGSGHRLTIKGDFQPATPYKIMISPKLQSSTGQRLKGKSRFEINSLDFLPSLFFQTGQTIIPPGKAPIIPIETINIPELHIQVRQVSPHQHKIAFKNFKKIPGTVVYADVIPMNTVAKNQKAHINLDLRPYLKPKHPLLITIRTPVEKMYPGISNGHQMKSLKHYSLYKQWVQVTDMAIDSFQDNRELFTMVTQIKDGSPIPNARVGVHNSRDGRLLFQTQTDASGFARIALPKEPYYLTAQNGADFCHSTEKDFYFPSKYLEGIEVITDREIYQPGETVSLKGWYRDIRDFKPTLAGVKAGTPVTITVRNDQYQVVKTLTTKLNRFGSFQIQYPIPEDAKPDYIKLQIKINEITRHHRILINTFKSSQSKKQILVDKPYHQIEKVDRAPARTAYQERMELELDREQYEPGRTAKLRITSSIKSGHGYAFIHRGKVLEKITFPVTGESTLIDLPVPRNAQGGATVTVAVFGRDKKGHPQNAYQTMPIAVSKEHLQLDIGLEARNLDPTQKTITIHGQVQQDGKVWTQDTEVLLFAVDETLLNLTHYELYNPLETYVSGPPGRLDANLFRRNIPTKDPPKTSIYGNLPLRSGRNCFPITPYSTAARTPAYRIDPNKLLNVQENDTPLALWRASVYPDEEGRFTETISLPDNSASYRIMAIATSGASHFGIGEYLITH